MERVKVVSSSVSEIGYEAQSQTLEVAFKPNRSGVTSVYRYNPVSQETFDSMLAEGASVGRIMNMFKGQPGIEAYKAGEEPAEAQTVSA